MVEVRQTKTKNKKENDETKNFIVDGDVHQAVKSYDELKPYLARTWWDRLQQPNATLPVSMYYRVKGLYALDAKPEEGVPGSDPELARKQLLDKYNIDYAILTGSLFGVSSHYNVDFGNAMASAFNEYTFDTWISHDDRWRASILVNTRDPIEAAKEIDRFGNHPKAAQVLMTFGSRDLFGKRQYHPIYEAAERNNLPIGIHLGAEGSGVNPPVSTSGSPSSNFERHNILPIHAMSHLNSIVLEGVFEKFPNLKMVFIEGGLAWIMSLLWRMDKNYKALRSDTPWLKRYPSEYVFNHIKFTTQPIEEPDNHDHLLNLLDMIHADKTVMFSTDYPHWDNDNPLFVLNRLSEKYKRNIAGETAKTIYRL